MSLETSCPNPACARRYTLAESVAGRSVKCKACGRTFVAGGSATIDAKATAPPGAAAPDGGAVGRFVVRGKLGAGAFGTVYRAYDPHLDREVALKVPNPGATANAKHVERFLREAKAAANLRHPHIVPVFDAGRDGDRYYIASAFIDGKPLADDIPDGGTDFTRAARLARELADALAYAHEQGIVHRDVKPQNVMLDTHDRVHLMDFGLASRQEEAARLTSDGAVMGTPSYMAPEQAAGQKGEAQPAADQYAVGVVLYELLTGRVPFEGPLPVVIHNAIHTEPDAPRTLRADIPRDLETICLKAMSKRPEGRYADCQALADDLRRWLEGEPISARRLSVRERATRWVKKEPKLSAAAALIALVLVVSVVLVSSAAGRANTSRRQAEKDAIDARTAEKRAEDALTEAREARAREEKAEGQTLGALGTAAQERKKAEALQAQVAAERKRAENAEVRTAEERGRADALTAQIDEERQKATQLRAKLTLAEIQTVEAAYQVYRTGNIAGASSVLQVVPADRRGWEWRHVLSLCVVPVAAATPVVLPGKKLSIGHLQAVAISPDGTRVVTAWSADNNKARVWDAKTGAELFRFEGHTGAVQSVAFSPDGSRVVTNAWADGARVWDANSGTELLALKGTGAAQVAAFSPDGTRLVASGKGITARVWDAKTGAELLVLTGHGNYLTAAAFSADGAQLVTCGAYATTARVWDAKTGVQLHVLSGNKHDIRAAVFSPDGARIVTSGADGVARVWEAKTGRELFVLKGHTGPVTSAVYSPDGTRIVTGSEDRTAQVWDAKSGAPLLSFQYPSPVETYPRGVHRVAWTADGSKLLIGLADRIEIRDAGPPPKP